MAEEVRDVSKGANRKAVHEQEDLEIRILMKW